MDNLRGDSQMLLKRRLNPLPRVPASLGAFGGWEFHMCEVVNVAGVKRFGQFHQDLVFFIGPRLDDTCQDGEAMPFDEAALKQRAAEVEQLLLPQETEPPALSALLNLVFDPPFELIFAEVTTGGKRGRMCPNLRIDMFESRLTGRQRPVNDVTPERTQALCAQLAEALGAKWVDAWYFGNFKKHQATYTAPAAEVQA